MKNKLMVVLAVSVSLLGGSMQMLGHHGTNISYDHNKEYTISGTVTEFRYANPHPQLYIDVKDSSGKVTKWGLEIAANLHALTLNGWSKTRSTNALKPGTIVSVLIAPSKVGTPVGVAMTIKNEKGEVILGNDN
jgi:hypothetical protein